MLFFLFFINKNIKQKILNESNILIKNVLIQYIQASVPFQVKSKKIQKTDKGQREEIIVNLKKKLQVCDEKIFNLKSLIGQFKQDKINQKFLHYSIIFESCCDEQNQLSNSLNEIIKKYLSPIYETFKYSSSNQDSNTFYYGSVDPSLQEINEPEKKKLQNNVKSFQILISNSELMSANRQIDSISNLNSTILENLSVHRKCMDDIRQRSIDTKNSISNGNKGLEKAEKYSSHFRYFNLLILISMTLILLFVDWLQ